MYNEKHNLFDKFKDLPPYVSGYLDAIMKAQLKVYGYYFLDKLLPPSIIEELQKSVPLEPNRDGVETIQYLYSEYFLSRKMACTERHELLGKLSDDFSVKLFTHNPTPELPKVTNQGPIDYYIDMPSVFGSSKINLNITLRSIKSGIPLRCMDIMGTGGFLLSNFQSDFYDIFVPGEDCVLYESQEDCVEKCRYYLAHDAEREQIAANGLGKIRSEHTYEIRLNEMFDIVFN
jgi:spore maturation protein CgeB